MKKICLILLLITCFSSCKSQINSKSVWTPEYEEKVYKQIDNAIRLRLPDNEKRGLLMSYIIKRLKAELPKGLESVSADSIHRLSTKIGAEYGLAHGDGQGGGLTPKATAWTPELEKDFRLAFLTAVKSADLANEKELCDCVITKLKKIYPDSVVVPFPNEIQLKVASECLKEFSKVVRK